MTGRPIFKNDMSNEHTTVDRLRGSVGKKQLIAIAAVLLLGGLGAAAILRMGGAPAPEEAEHGHGHSEAPGHGDNEHHDKGEPARGPQKPAEEAHTEGAVAMTAEQIKAAGVSIETAGPATLRTFLQLPGEIAFNDDRTAHVVPRVAGVVEAVPVSLGQQVRKGQVLAVISSISVSDQRAELQSAQKRQQLARTTYEREKQLFEQRISPQQDVQQAEQALREAEIAVSNARQKLQALGASAESAALNRYELRAPFNGVIVGKHISLGEQVREDANVFTVSDLTSVWAQVSVPARDLPSVRLNERVTIKSTAFEQTAVGKVAYVGALIGEQTRTAQARVVLDNPEGAWRPGLFVNVEVAAGESAAPVAVLAEAVQTLEGRPVVFVRTATGFAPAAVELGRSDGLRVEVKAGLKAGAAYAGNGSFVIKSEAGKASASHEH